jgi:hypothetical protein
MASTSITFIPNVMTAGNLATALKKDKLHRILILREINWDE